MDADKLVLVGRSLAGYLAPRAAAFEHRIAALVCDPPDPNLGSHIPGGLVGLMAAPIISVEEKLSADKREFFRARMATHGVRTIEDYFATLRDYDMLSVASQITAPTLLVECENDPLAGSDGAKALASRMTQLAVVDFPFVRVAQLRFNDVESALALTREAVLPHHQLPDD